jgi:hypothetical protein
MGMEQQVNRRRWERYPFDASVRVVVDHAKVNHRPEPRSWMPAVYTSARAGCVFFAANLPVGSHIKVEFTNPHTDEPVRLHGKVRNRSVYLYGVEFLSEKFEDRQQLARLSAGLRSGGGPSA